MIDRMHCPKCGQRYPDSFQRYCDVDGVRLVSDTSGESTFGGGARRSGAAAARTREPFSGEEGTVLELGEDVTRRDDEIIRDDEMAEIFRRERVNATPKADRRIRPRKDVEILQTEMSTAARKSAEAHRVDPDSIPLGHVDLDERERNLARINEFDPSAPEKFVGSTVKGRYRVVEMIGEDDAGYAYLAEDRIVGDRRVIVRILSPFEGDEITATILAEERVRLSHLNHPNVARVFDSGSYANGIKYLISEHLDGLSGDEILKIHGRFDPDRAGKLVRQVAYAIADVHKHGILHRDIRPENMEIAHGEADTALKVVGFGVSTGEPNEENIRYLAPEVIEGGVSTAASDIYSLGITAYQFLTGDFPFDGETERELLKAERAGYAQKLSPKLDAFFQKALAPSPRDRFTTAREFGDAFFAAVADRPAIGEAKPVATEPAVAKKRVESKETLRITPVVETEPTSSSKVAETPAAAAEEDLGPAWTRRSPERLNEPNAKWLKIALATFVALTIFFAIAWAYMLSRPAPANSANVDPNANAAYDPTETPPPARDVTAPPDSIYFDNNKANLRGDLFRNFVGFSLYYPKTWKVVGPQSASDHTSRGKFLDISKLSSDGRLQEQMLVSYYASRGTYSDDVTTFPTLVKEANETLSKLMPDYSVVSEGPTTVNGWKAYELKFQGSGTQPNGQKLSVWGRRIFIPAARPGVRNGFELTLLATSNSNSVRSVDEVGTSDDLASVLATFEPGRSF